MTPAVRVADLTKIFRVWRRPADMLIEAVTGRQRHAEFTALNGVSFDVQRGSIVGVLGRNGAGKSTLLRIIAGTLDATSGEVTTDGKVAAILELGTGFHPEYTGRENIFLGGLCLGLSQKEVNHKLDEIIEFSELAEFIDQPFRTYSSGMQARLTFAVATSVDPDVLIVDEALSVGDARFALKSFDRIRDFARRNKSILFVSHDINQVTTFCDEALMLERGEKLAHGEPKQVGNTYHRLLFGGEDEAAVAPADEAPAPAAPAGSPHDSEAVGNGVDAARITAFAILDREARRVTELETLESYTLSAEIEANDDCDEIALGVLIRTYRGVEVAVANLPPTESTPTVSLKKGDRSKAIVEFQNNLAPGHYFATLSLIDKAEVVIETLRDALEFVVAPAPGVYSASLGNLDAKFSVSSTETGSERLVASQ
ncbi:MAG: ABC transporter ATP-binding protein [Pseudomonadota bacterium]